MESTPPNSTKGSSSPSSGNKIKEKEADFKFAEKPPTNNNLLPGWKKADVVTNFLRVNFNQQNKKVWEYAIVIDGKFNEDDQKKRAIKQLLPKLREQFSPFKLSGNSFFSMANVPDDLNFTLNINEEDINCTVKNTKHYIDLANVNQKATQFNNDVKSFFEKVIKQIIMSNKRMLRIKDSYYDLTNMKNMEEKSFLMSGFSTGFRNCDSGFLLLVNIKNKFINGVNCLDKLSEFRRKFTEGNDFQIEAKNYFNNLTIMTTYGNPRTYRLTGVNFEKNIMNTTIKMRNTGEDISLLQYYNTNYPDQKIKSNNQPLLVVEKRLADESTEEIYLVPELCNLTGMEDNSTELKSKMTNRTRIRPNDKMRQIEGFLNLINSREKKQKKSNGVVVKELESPMEIRDDWGIKFDGFKQTVAKVIPPPMVNFAKNQTGPAGSRIQYKEIIDSQDRDTHLENGRWKILVHQKNRSHANQIVENFRKCSRRMGVNIGDPSLDAFSANNTEGILNEISRMRLDGNLQIVLIILDRFTEKSYKEIKKFINCEIGIPSQVVKCENLSKNLSYFTNVLNQMIIKMGKRLFTIQFNNELSKIMTSFVGLLIEKCGKNKKVIITCSYDEKFCKYYSNEAVCKIEELSDCILNLFSNAMSFFANKYNGKTPGRYFIYRSGVSDAEKKNLFKEEINLIDKYLLSVNPNTQYIYTVVNKKNDIKFFENEQGNLKNPCDGTVLDRDVTSSGCYEFFMQNQFVNQGCATPTHYHVLKSTLGIPMEQYQLLTFHMSYYYWNWPGPTRLPACLKFAETYSKNLGNISLGDKFEIKDNLRSKPFYV